MGVVVALVEPELPSALRREFAERIAAAWHKSREKIIALGRALIDAKAALPVGEFTAMIERDLPFKPWTARQFMRITAESKFLEPDRCNYNAALPDAARALDKLRRLNDEQFEAAIGTGAIHPAMTIREADDLVGHYLAPAPFAIDKPHRPQAPIKYAPPSAPGGLAARSVSELVFLMAERRHVLKLSQNDVDAKIGWSDALCSKYEIPHRDDGRVASLDALFEWCQALGVGIRLVTL